MDSREKERAIEERGERREERKKQYFHLQVRCRNVDSEQTTFVQLGAGETGPIYVQS